MFSSLSNEEIRQWGWFNCLGILHKQKYRSWLFVDKKKKKINKLLFSWGWYSIHDIIIFQLKPDLILTILPDAMQRITGNFTEMCLDDVLFGKRTFFLLLIESIRIINCHKLFQIGELKIHGLNLHKTRE